MNSPCPPLVERLVHGLRVVSTVLAAALFGMSSAACVEVNGGAVELSWYLISASSETGTKCGNVGIEQVRICWTPADTAPADIGTLACTPDRMEVFPCTDSRGATDFSIESGPQLFWIEPLCAGGEPLAASAYEVPPPILRSVERGSMVTLSSLLIVDLLDGLDGCGEPAAVTHSRDGPHGTM